MKILILHQHFNSPDRGGALRSYFLARALVEKGIETVVITAHNQPGYLVKQFEGIEIHYLPVAYQNQFGFYKRGVSFVRFVLRAVKVVARIKDVDCCYAISVPITVGLAAIWIKRLYKLPFIFEVGDLWPDAPVQLGFIRNPALKQSLYKLEKRIYRKAKAIVALSPSIQQMIKGRAPDKKVFLVPNMADTEFYLPAPKHEQLEKKFDVAGKFVVSYIGAVGFANGLDFYLACAQACDQARLPIHFLLCGDGAMLPHLKSRAQQLNLKSLSFIPFQNREGVREVMNITDAAFICYRHAPILETGSPHKYFDGLAAGKLIVINFQGWIKEEVENEQCGVYIDPKQPADFVKKIKRFVEDRVLLKLFSENSRSLGERKYARHRLSEEFVQLVKAFGHY